jgi:hypothetical protein
LLPCSLAQKPVPTSQANVGGDLLANALVEPENIFVSHVVDATHCEITFYLKCQYAEANLSGRLLASRFGLSAQSFNSFHRNMRWSKPRRTRAEFVVCISAGIVRLNNPKPRGEKD